MSVPTTAPRDEKEGEGRPRPKARGRRWRRWAAGLAVVVLGSALAIDWWAPAAAELWLGGVTHSRRSTEWGRSVRWAELEWAGPTVKLHVANLRVNAPSRLLRGEKLEAEGDGWTAEFVENTHAGSSAKKTSTGAAWEQVAPALRELSRELKRRVGEVRLRNGVLRVAGEEIAVEDFWLKGVVVSATLRARGQTVRAESDLELGALWGSWVEGAVGYYVELWADRGRAEFSWAGNKARGDARFKKGKWIPVKWSLRGSDWRVSAQGLGFGSDTYEDLAGDFVLSGEGATFAGSVNAEARSKRDALPPLRVELAGGGDAEGVRVDRLELVAPQARARLSAPVGWKRATGWSADGEPRFAWEADLAALSGGEVRGRAEGTAHWVRGGEGGARVRWEARGSGLGWRHLADGAVVMRGESDMRTSTVTEAVLTAGQGMRVEARGRVHHATRLLEGLVLRAEAEGTALGPWLPAGVGLGRVAGDFRAAGLWPKLEVEGTLKAERLAASGWGADTLDARVAGRVGERLSGQLNTMRGAANIQAKGEWTPGTFSVSDLTWRRADGAALSAAKPWRVETKPGARRVDLGLSGADATRLDLSWSEGDGAVASIQVEEMGSEWLQDWRVAGELPLVRLRRLSGQGRLGSAGIAEGGGELDLAWRTPSGELWARAAGRLGEGGATLERLEGGRGDAILMSGAGFAPLRVRGGGEARVEAVPGATWDLRLESRPGATWWDELAKLADIEIAGPEASLRVAGEAKAPRAGVAFGAESLRLRGEELPQEGLELKAIHAEAALTLEEIVLKRLDAKVDGQAVSVEGRLAVGEGDWRRLRERPVAWLSEHAEAKVSVPGAEVAAIARYLPTLLAPQGVLKADLQLSPGARLDGSLELRNAATRPLGGFGVLQDVEVALSLSGTDVRIETMRATAGGQELTVQGGARRVPGKPPALDLTVKAERFPLLRKPGLLLRGDLDLTVKTAEDGRTKPFSGGHPGLCRPGRRARRGGGAGATALLFGGDPAFGGLGAGFADRRAGVSAPAHAGLRGRGIGAFRSFGDLARTARRRRISGGARERPFSLRELRGARGSGAFEGKRSIHARLGFSRDGATPGL